MIKFVDNQPKTVVNFIHIEPMHGHDNWMEKDVKNDYTD